MNFTLKKSIEILERTPQVLDNLLRDLSGQWINTNEGGETWSPFDVMGHLVHGEKTDWIPRAEIILSTKLNKTFQPFDRFAQLEESKGKSINDLLEEFKDLREANIRKLRSWEVTEEQLKLKGMHPALGEVMLSQLLSCWVVHDLNHIAQITRVMANQYKEDVGPWIQYLGILNR